MTPPEPDREPYGPLFPIQRAFYDQIVAGTKKVEFRSATKRWRSVADRVWEVNVVGWTDAIAVFQCGRDIHRRLIMMARPYASMDKALEGCGLPPNPNAALTVGTGPVIAFYLGEVVP